jgi:hypothetical protein
MASGIFAEIRIKDMGLQLNEKPCSFAGLENRLDLSLRFSPPDRPRAEEGSKGERQHL